MRFIQKFFGGGQLLPPCCDECMSRSIGLWETPDGKCHYYCKTHAKENNAEVIPGAWYVPTGLAMPGYAFRNGQFVKFQKPETPQPPTPPEQKPDTAGKPVTTYDVNPGGQPGGGHH